MRTIRIAAAALNQTPLDFAGNRARALSAIEAARAVGSAILCLPELALTGYGCEDQFQASGLVAQAWQSLAALVPATQGLAVAVGLPISHGGALFNTACLVVDGRIAGLVAKQNLAGDGIHYEPRWFKPWPPGCVADLAVGGETYPLGDLLFTVDGVRIGIEICEDAWVAGRPGIRLSQRGADVILNPSASHFAFGKHEARRRIVTEGSRALGVSAAYANLLGNEAGRVIYDGDTLIAAGGDLVASGPRFSFQDWVLTTAVVDVDATRLARARLVSRAPNLGRSPGDVCVSWHMPAAAWAVPPAAPPAPPPKEEEFARAVALGLFDYLRKSHANGFVLSLSGGADSAAVAVLVAAMVHAVYGELGAAGVAQKLGHRGIPLPEGPESLVREILTCVYQATAHSSATTENAAHGLARALGTAFLRLDVEPLVAGYVELVSTALGRPLTWEQDDLALQNIQARARAPGVWLLANVQRALLLATANRSEAAVGYTTMDGDTCGGLAPLAGIDKGFLRHWLLHAERVGVPGLGPVAALAAVNAQAPTAELRPAGEGQTDEGDLMPYVVLNLIEQAMVRDKRAPLEALAVLKAHFPAEGEAVLCEQIRRFCRLFAMSQWKRERLAPSFHLDDHALDPRAWLRFPILSHGFEEELALLPA